nr:MAG TPA: YtxH-like protein [Caudoviricetes sp.]
MIDILIAFTLGALTGAFGILLWAARTGNKRDK